MTLWDLGSPSLSCLRRYLSMLWVHRPSWVEILDMEPADESSYVPLVLGPSKLGSPYLSCLRRSLSMKVSLLTTNICPLLFLNCQLIPLSLFRTSLGSLFSFYCCVCCLELLLPTDIPSSFPSEFSLPLGSWIFSSFGYHYSLLYFIYFQFAPW